jgi:hypothetical protein
MASPFVSKDGSKHTNHDSMKRSDARFAARQPQRKAPAAESGSEEEMGGEQEPQDGAALAAEHGPAVEINVSHNHEAGEHRVHAVHPDGHEHESQHGSADEAHQFAAEAAGVGGADAGDGMDDGE